MVADQISVPTNSRGTLPRGAAEGWRKDLPTSQSKCVRSSKSLDQFWARRRYCSGLFDWRRDARRRRAGLRRGLRPAAFDSDRRIGGQAESTWSWNYSCSEGASRPFGSGSSSVWRRPEFSVGRSAVGSVASVGGGSSSKSWAGRNSKDSSAI